MLKIIDFNRLMLIFSRYNLMLLAVPKTGSTALEVVLGPEAGGRFGNLPELKHLPLYRYNRFARPLLQLLQGKVLKPSR